MHILTNIIRFLPEDKSGDWFYHAMESLGAIITIVMIIIVWLSPRYENEFDTVKFYFIVIVAFAFALFIRPAISRRSWLNFFWIFSFYVETFAIIPQFWLFTKKVLFYLIFIGRNNRRLHGPFCGWSRIFKGI